MILIVCLDDRNGMAFGGRRQSRDRELTARIAARVGAARLWTTPYSAPLFEGLEMPLSVDADCLTKAAAGDFCFVETQEVPPDLAVEALVVYRWNRHYPGDLYFPADRLLPPLTLVSATDFVGYSHDTITEELYHAP